MASTYYYTSADGDNSRALDFFAAPEANEKTPLVVFIHGGAWRSEDKSDYKQLATDCLSLGISVVSVNYRLSLLEKDQTVSNVQHPSHIQDVGAAVQFLAQTPLNNQYDNQQVYLVGHSAGAHIALMLLLDDRFQPYIKGVIGVSGIYHIPLLLSTFPSYLDFIQQAFGSCDYYQASPVSQHAIFDATVIIAQSRQDSLIDNQQALVMTEHLKSLNAKVELDMSLKGDHFEVMNFDNLGPLIQKLVF